MKRFDKKIYFAALSALLAALCVSGCLRVSADELYSLPRASEQYVNLQEQIDLILSQGAEFSPPAGGSNRQAVQIVDLNGDGINEVVAFFLIAAESTLKTYIFTVENGYYTVTETIEGTGTAIDSARYADMDGDGTVELIVGWQMSSALKYFSIYSLKDFHSVLLATREYTEIAVFDLTGDGNDDITALRVPAPGTGTAAELLVLMPDGELVSSETRLSEGIEVITRVLPGKLVDGVPAIFIDSEGTYNDGNIVTDICAYSEGVLMNLTMKPSGISEDTVRARAGISDISEDGVIKIPRPQLLQPQSQSETAYYSIDWHAYNSKGGVQLALTTYHNTFDEWYLILPFDWRGKVTVRREDVVSGERTVIFSYIVDDNNIYEDFLKIHRLSGDAGVSRANLPGRTLLPSEGSSVYVFELLAPPNSFGLTFDEEIIARNFRLIYSEWLTGSV